MTKDHQTETDDLVDRLEDSKGWPNLGKAAAARIKALSAELSETKKDVTDMETRALKAEAENARLRDVLKPFATSLERYSGFTDYALFGIWEDVNGAAGRKLNILRKSDFDKARAALEEKNDE